MTREEAINILNGDNLNRCSQKEREALDMAIKALENIGHLTDRPCDVCEFQKENGCSQWTCVFSNGLFGGMA